MPLPRPDGKVGPSNDVVLSLTPIPCATLCGAASHHRPALVRYAGPQAPAPSTPAGLGSRMYRRGSENDAAMQAGRTTVPK